MTDPKTRSLVPTRMLTHDGLAARRMRTYRLTLERTDAPPRAIDIDAPTVRVGSRSGNDVVLEDEAVSRLHFEITIDELGYRLVDLESTNGTFVDELRVRDVYLRSSARIRAGNTTLRFDPLDVEADVPAAPVGRFGPLIGSSVAMREVFAVLEKAARSNATVLVEGETGTGKELVARAVHEASPRREGPFVVFDCASVPANLLESELFGHEKGAFTGATGRRIGRMEEADGGTLFIDELGELPIELQPKLLRALELREVRRVGGTATLPVDIRIVAATNRELAKEVNRGAFREDLYYRLAVVRVVLPPLRKRRDDVHALVTHVIERALRDDPERARRTLASISEANWQRLESHPWPGNVRQLKNVIERTLALSGGDDVRSIDPPTMPRMTAATPPPGDAGSGATGTGGAEGRGAGTAPALDLDRPFVDLKAEVLSAFEQAYLEGQLARHDGNFSRAAAAAGIDRMYFKRLLKKYR